MRQYPKHYINQRARRAQRAGPRGPGRRLAARLEALEGFDGVREGLVGRRDRAAAQQAADRAEEELDVLDGVRRHEPLVEVRLERHVLDVLAAAHVDEGLARRVVRVEDLLEDVQHLAQHDPRRASRMTRRHFGRRVHFL